MPPAPPISQPETEKEAELSVHRGAAAVINGTERTFLDKYSDYIRLALVPRAVRHWFGRCMAASLSQPDERDENTVHRNRILAAASEICAVQSDSEFAATQREVDAIIKEALTCFDEGAIEQEDLAAFALALEPFDHAVAEARGIAGWPDGPARAPTGAPTLASRR